MSALGYTQLVYSSTGDGAALSNTTTPTSLLPTAVAGATKWTMPSGFFKAPGDQLLFRASGRISTLATTPGTFTLDLRIGAVVVANGGAMTLSTTAKTNVAWSLEWLLTARAIGGGTAANFFHQGDWWSEAAGATSVTGEMKGIGLPQSAPAIGTGFDSGAAAVFDLFATWSTASASNSALCHQSSLLSL